MVKIQIMMNVKETLLQWFKIFLINKLLLRVQINLPVEVLTMKIFLIKNYRKNSRNQLL